MLGLLRRIAALPKPVVAVVRGHVRAGGVGLVGACDVAVVTDDSTVRLHRVAARTGAGGHLADDPRRG